MNESTRYLKYICGQKLQLPSPSIIQLLLTVKAVTLIFISGHGSAISSATVVPTKSDSDVILCLQLLSKTLTCTLHFSLCESIDHVCINPILWIGLIHK